MDITTLGIAVDSRQVKEGSRSLDGLAKSAQGAESSTKRLGKETDSTNAHFSKMSGLLRVLATAFAGLQIAQQVKEIALMSARYETMGAVMKIVGNNAGYTKNEMAGFETQLRKTGIAAIEAREVLSRMAQSNIDLTKSSELARIAQDAAVIGGINSSEAFERMVHGIQSGNQIILRTIGINVSFEKSYETLAAQLGKNADDLSELEKAQARANAVVEYGPRIAGAYEAALGTAGKQIQSMKRYLDDLKVSAGEALQPALISIVQDLTSALKSSHEWLEKNKDEMLDMGVGLKSIISSGKDLVSYYKDELSVLVETLIIAKVAQIAFNFAVSANPYVRAALALGVLNEAMKEYNMGLGASKQKMEGFATHARNIGGVLSGRLDPSTGAELTKLDKLKKELISVESQLKGMSDPSKPWYMFSFLKDNREAEKRLESLKVRVIELNKAAKAEEFAASVFGPPAPGDLKGKQKEWAEELARVSAAKAAMEEAAAEERKAAAREKATEAAKKYATEQQRLMDVLLPLQKLEKDHAVDLGMLENWYSKNTKKAVEYASAKALLVARFEEQKAALQVESIQWQEAEAEARKYWETQQRLIDTLLPLQTAEREHAQDLAMLNDRYAKNTEKVVEYQVALANLNDRLDKVKNSVVDAALDEFFGPLDEIQKKFAKTTTKMTEFQIQAYRNMHDAAADFFFDPFKDGLSGMLDSFLKMTQRMVAEWMAAQALMGLFGKDFGTGGALGGVLGSAVGAISGAWNTPGNFLGDMHVASYGGGRASGGPVGPGKFYEVNERGPELLEMGNRQFLMMGNSSGNVVPGGGSKVQVNVINNASGTRATAQERSGSDGGRIIDVFVEQVKGAIASDISRGSGVIPAAMGSTYGLNRVPGAY